MIRASNSSGSWLMQKVSKDTSKNTWTTSEQITDVERECKAIFRGRRPKEGEKWQAMHFEPAGANPLQASSHLSLSSSSPGSSGSFLAIRAVQPHLFPTPLSC